MGTLLLPLVLLVMFAPGAWAEALADPGVFLNINCGATMDIVDPETALTWYGDDKYVDSTGYISRNVAANPGRPQVESLRFFNDSRVSKYCYRMPVTSNSTYMVRAEFYHGGYSTAMPSFQMSLDGLKLIEQIWSSTSINYYYEFTYQAQGNATFLCLLRDDTDTDPYISAISLRQINPYPTMLEKHLSKGYAVYTRARYNFGAADPFSRYPKDVYDRYWHHVDDQQPEVISATSPLSTLATASSISYGRYDPPAYSTIPTVIFQSALTSAGNMTLTLYHWPGTKGFVIFYFAELDPAVNATSREFTVNPNSAGVSTVNMRKTYGPDGSYLFWDDLEFVDPRTETVVFAPAPGSVYGPILNALEFFEILSIVAPAKTVNDDAFAIEHIKSSLKLANWTGDPCVPVPHSWVVCSSLGPPTIETVDVSKFNLSGAIPMEINELPKLTTLILSGNNFEGLLTDLSLLKNLRILHLQDNNLTGPLPAWLGQLPLLKELYVHDNNFDGSIPSSLLSKNGLDFRYRPGNPLLIVGPVPDKKFNIWVIVGPILGVGLVGILAAAALIYYCCVYKRRRSKLPVPPAPSAVELGDSRTPNAGCARSFSAAAIAASTENFKRVIGKGGFGPVYYGKLPSGEQVAVKVLDRSASIQGAAQFFNEVDVLSKVHHRNLVSLLGYCNEGENRMLVYEYLPQGSLRDRLDASSRLGVLDFKARLNIALNAAQGLDYLHTGCNPGIVHRDVKSTNILLTGTKEAAKVGDFGLSRLAPGDADNGSMTIVQGTRGYIDPEYVNSHFLTTKSDVYSFGVVLLELLTGRLPLPSSSVPSANHAAWTLCDWVRTTLQSGAAGMQEILDRDLRPAAPNAGAVWSVADLAMRCVEPRSVHRPFMIEVVQELRNALTLEGDGPNSHAPTHNIPPTSSEFLQHPVQQSDDSTSGTFSAADMSWPGPR